MVIVGQIAEPKSLDPHAVTAVNDFRILMNVYDGLVRYADGKLEVEPALATSWEISDDGLTYTLAGGIDVMVEVPPTALSQFEDDRYTIHFRGNERFRDDQSMVAQMERQRNPGSGWPADVNPDCAPMALHPGYGLSAGIVGVSSPGWCRAPTESGGGSTGSTRWS